MSNSKDPDEPGIHLEATASHHARVYQAGGNIVINESIQQYGPVESDGLGAGWPISNFSDPHALEVHRAIDVPQPGTGAKWPLLPTYIERPHDLALRERLQQAASGTSAIAVLVGDSSTGKTRACWEAIQQLPTEWRLWHPIAPGRPQALLAGVEAVKPRTVLWLNDIQHYLLTSPPDLGEEAAAKLRVLMRDTDRCPVLILGTIWRDYWSVLTTQPGPSRRDDHSQARVLLTGSSIEIPDSFSNESLASARVKSAVDMRLTQALEQAKDGRITQYLAGAPALLERYRTAPAIARAVIEAAMDARRLQPGLAIPQAFLLSAAPGYLSEQQWQECDDGWFERALSYVIAPCNGAVRPLALIRHQSGMSAVDQPMYRLADYLEQHAGRTRRFSVPPRTFWEAAEYAATVEDVAALAIAAGRRWRLRHAERLALHAASFGNTSALRRIAGLLAWRGNLPLAERLCRQAAEAGDPEAMGKLALIVDDMGEHERAEVFAQQAANAGEPSFLRTLGVRLRSDPLAAERLFRKAADAGDNESLREAARLRRQAGDPRGAEQLYEQAARAGNSEAMLALADIRRTAQDELGEEQLLWTAADASNGEAMRLLVRYRELAGDYAGAEELAVQFAEAGHTGVLFDLAWFRGGSGHDILNYRDRTGGLAGWRERTGVNSSGIRYHDPSVRLADAERLYELAAEAGNRDAVGELSLYKELAGDQIAAERLAVQAAEAGSFSALGELVRRRARAGDQVAAERLADQAAAAGDSGAALAGIAGHCGDTGREAEAERLFQKSADAGNLHARLQLARMREEAGDQVSAEQHYQRVAEVSPGAIEQLAVNTKMSGNSANAIRLYRRAAEAGDPTALEVLSRERRSAGDWAGAERLARQAADVGNPAALLELAAVRRADPRWGQLLSYGLEADGQFSNPW